VRKYVRFGASPRGAQAMILAAKVQALLDGRPNVAADDVRTLAPAALRHRLVLGYEATADRVSADVIVDELLDAVPPPSAGIRA
jgi:MoxR-like ATPase